MRTSSRPWLGPALVGAALLLAGVAYVALRPHGTPAPAPAKSAPLTEAQKFTRQARALIDDDLMAARENFHLAEELGQRAVALAPDDGEAWATLGRISCEIMSRNYETSARRRELARSQSERAARLAPDSVETGLATAAYLELTAEFSAAQDTLRTVMSRAPADSRVAIAYARILGRLNQHEQAQEFERTHPTYAGSVPRAMAAQAGSLRSPGNYARALELVDRAQAITPSRDGYRVKLLLLVNDLGDLQAARAFAEKLPPLLQEDVFAALVTRAWLRLGDSTKALTLLNNIPRDFFEENRRVEPKGYLTGRALELSGKPVAAEAEWKTALTVVERRLAAEPNRPIYLRFKAVLQALITARRSGAHVAPVQ